MLREYIDKHFFYLLIFTLIFGVLFYDTLGITFTDEICAIITLVLYGFHIFHTPKWEINKLFIFTLLIFLFYFCYSFYIKSNIKIAIITDFIIQIKPYLGFFCIYAITPRLDKKKKIVLQCICIFFAFYLFILGICDLFNSGIITSVMDHPSRYATAVSIIAILFLYTSDYTLKNKIIFLLLLSIGLISGRSKFYGFFIICSFIIFYITDNFKLKLNIKNILYLSIALGLVFLVTKDKFYLYFIQGGFGEGKGETDLFARMALYYFSTDIIADYFPFGSGFGSYATFASAEYYSPLYEKYNINLVYGLSKDFNSFISDTYYPALAQFGIVGVTLFFAFWLRIIKNAIMWHNIQPNSQHFSIIILIVSFFLIECTTDSTFTHNRGLFMMMLLGLVMSNFKESASNNINHIQA